MPKADGHAQRVLRTDFGVTSRAAAKPLVYAHGIFSPDGAGL
jgi:hypothetical protein